MCGAGHTRMRGIVIVETQEEFDIWMASQKPKYAEVMEAKKPVEVKKDSTPVTVQPVAKLVPIAIGIKK